MYPKAVKQAVILAGGRGTRMRPLTDQRPKPMIQVANKPFIEHLVIQLRDEGITDLLVLLGYMPDTIRNHLGNGEQFGVRISYQVTPEEYETAHRLKSALPYLDQHFLLVYGDNFCPINLKALWQSYTEGNVLAQTLAYRNDDHFTRSNLEVNKNGFVEHYDPTRRKRALSAVDIGYSLVNRSVIKLVDSNNLSFGAAIFPALVRLKALRAYITDHRYYSIGSPERMEETRQFFRRIPTVILDRDGVLNERMASAKYVRSWSEWQWIPGAKDAIRDLTRAGHRIVVVTNQPGIAKGQLTEEALNNIHANMLHDINHEGGHIDAIYCCPHSEEDRCKCRKPAPGMLIKAQRELKLDLTRTLFMGDDDRDYGAALEAGCRFEWISRRRPLQKVVSKYLEKYAEEIAA